MYETWHIELVLKHFFAFQLREEISVREEELQRVRVQIWGALANIAEID